MAISKKFSYLPTVIFVIDNNWEIEKEIEKIAEQIKQSNNE
jgi:PII-like signaling protein